MNALINLCDSCENIFFQSRLERFTEGILLLPNPTCTLCGYPATARVNAQQALQEVQRMVEQVGKVVDACTIATVKITAAVVDSDSPPDEVA